MEWLLESETKGWIQSWNPILIIIGNGISEITPRIPVHNPKLSVHTLKYPVHALIIPVHRLKIPVHDLAIPVQ